MESIEYTQMKVRMPVELKRNGDAALESIGFTPTEAVRALWEKAAARGRGLEEVAIALSAKVAEADPESDPLSKIQRGRAIVDEGMVALGISREAMAASMLDDASLLDAVRNELAREKGWM